VNIRETTVQTTFIAIVIVHSAVAKMIHGSTIHGAENATHQKNAAQVKPGLLTNIIVHASPPKLAVQVIAILKIFCAVMANTTVAQEILGPQTRIVRAIQTTYAAQVKQTVRIIVVNILIAVLATTGQQTLTVFAIHSRNAASAIFGHTTSCANAIPNVTAAQDKLGMRTNYALAIQQFLAA
jgi:hypothetical protein